MVWGKEEEETKEEAVTGKWKRRVKMIKMMMKMMNMSTQSSGSLKLLHPRSAITLNKQRIRVLWLWKMVVVSMWRVKGDPLWFQIILEDKDLYTLRQEKDQVEEQLNQTKRKLEEVMWDERARGYHEVVRVCIQHFHKALMNNLRKCEESAELKEVRGDMEQLHRNRGFGRFQVRGV